MANLVGRFRRDSQHSQQSQSQHSEGTAHATSDDPRDLTIQKLQDKIESMDEEKTTYVQKISALETRVDELNTLKEAYESKIEAFESLFRMMNDDAQAKKSDEDLFDSVDTSCSSTESDNSGFYCVSGRRVEI